MDERAEKAGEWKGWLSSTAAEKMRVSRKRGYGGEPLSKKE